MPNAYHRRNLRALIELLTDNHQEASMEANGVCISMEKLDEAIGHVVGKGSTGVRIYHKQADRRLSELQSLLVEQGNRCLRVAAEVEEMRKNVKLA